MNQPPPGRIDVPCPSCGRILHRGGEGRPEPLRCPGCAEALDPPGGPPLLGAAPGRCHVCGCPHLYAQRDFNQKLGCLIVLAGAVLVPWTYGLSLPVVALIDWLLYRRLPPIAVCYVCSARYRGVPPREEHAPYDLVMAQTLEARSLSWADGRRRPAFAHGEAPLEPTSSHGD